MTDLPSQNASIANTLFKSAKIANIVDQFRIVINAGAKDGVTVGQRFLIYKIGSEVIDPDTRKSLGRLEVVKGIGEVIHVQERMSTLQTTEKHEIQRRPTGWNAVIHSIEVSKEPRAFIDPEIGDIAKPIS